MDIVPGVGVGPIRLGMTPADVRRALPEPEAGWEPWAGGNCNDSLLFRGLRLRFSRCDGRGPLPDAVLWGIQVHRSREDAALLGRPLAGWDVADLWDHPELRQPGLDVGFGEDGRPEVVDVVKV